MNEKQSMNGFIDIHQHGGPDGDMVRKRTDFELAEAAKKEGMAGIVLKAHTRDTTESAKKINDELGTICYGSLVLNNGIDPDQAERAITSGARLIYFPTINALNHKGSIKITNNGVLIPEAVRVLELTCEQNVPVSTGHSSLEETIALVDKAKEIGTRVIVIHPELALTFVPLEIQKRLAGDGIYFERTFYGLRNPNYPNRDSRSGLFEIDDQALELMVENIRNVGVSSTILSSDLGQPWNVEPVQGFRYFLDLMRKYFDDNEVLQMGRVNPAFALGNVFHFSEKGGK